MEWYIMNSTGVRSLATSLVEKVSEDKYVVSDECAELIEELLMKMSSDDIRTSVTKRHLLAEKLLTRDLFPIIKYASPDVNELQLVLRLLAELCEPMDALRALTPPPAHNVINDLTKLTHAVKRAFRDMHFVQRMFENVSHLIQEAGECEMAAEGYECIRDMLSLIRNILYHSYQNENHIQQTALKMLLLKNNLGTILTYSITCHGRDNLAIGVAQILSLLYRKFEWKVNIEEVTATSRQEALAEQYINDRLKYLMVQLLQGSLSTLVLTLNKGELMESSSTNNYMYWCLAYFLPFINQVPVSISKIRGLLSSKFFGYLVYKISMMATDIFSESIDNAAQRQQNETRLMMMFSALESLINVGTSYKLLSLNGEEQRIIMQFYKDLVEMSDVWQILLFYIRKFDLTRFPRSFLSQLVCINHNLLTAVEFYNKMSCSQLENTVLQHIKQFASPQLIEQYTTLVSSYATNSPQTNMAVFTMLCHICVDCDQMNLLYTPTLIRLLGGITDNINASIEDRQLALHVTRSFLEDLTARPELCVESFINTTHVSMDTMTDEDEDVAVIEDNSTPAQPEWSDAEESELFSICSDITDHSNTETIVNQITSRFEQLGLSRSKNEVADKLRQLGIISTADEETTVEQEEAELSALTKHFCKEGNEDFVNWIQHSMLTASYIKAMPKDRCFKTSPVCRYSFLLNHPFPMIPCTEKQSRLLKSDPKAIQLLEYLKLSYHEFDGCIIPLIPETKTAGELYTAAEKLNSVEPAVTSDASDTTDEDILEQQISKASMSSESQRSGPCLPYVESNIWLTYMQKVSTSS